MAGHLFPSRERSVPCQEAEPRPDFPRRSDVDSRRPFWCGRAESDPCLSPGDLDSAHGTLDLAALPRPEARAMGGCAPLADGRTIAAREAQIDVVRGSVAGRTACA